MQWWHLLLEHLTYDILVYKGKLGTIFYFCLRIHIQDTELCEIPAHKEYTVSPSQQLKSQVNMQFPIPFLF